ncbi:hypothetical protein [Devosia lacusdianchii]|jgi:hypothetical protein|uniref:hypothetical protein n=1 Tax=Devosia lacusdianchii TaxID=2917991 RepID=UPI001F05C2D9|nr:hypothetical protein [Devosia sp. JXJ CY 41]
MSKTFAFAFAIATLAGLAASVPTQAATRAVDFGPTSFANRCAAQGGVIADASPTFACQTPVVEVVCSFVRINLAHCEWPGIDNQIAVNRIIGLPSSYSLSSGGGAGAALGGGGGGFKNDLPLDNGGGGGGIDLPDLPIDNGGGGGGIDLPDLPISN